jgi:hypothetical protein
VGNNEALIVNQEGTMEYLIEGMIFAQFLLLCLIYRELRGHTRQQKVIGEAAIKFFEMTEPRRVRGLGLADQEAVWPWWSDV